MFGNLEPCNEMISAVVKCVKQSKHNGYAPSTGIQSPLGFFVFIPTEAKTSLSQVFWFNSITLFLTFFYQLYTICMVGYVKAREAIAAEHSFPLSPITYKVKIGYSYLRIVYFCSILLIESIKCIYLVLTDSS